MFPHMLSCEREFGDIVKLEHIVHSKLLVACIPEQMESNRGSCILTSWLFVILAVLKTFIAVLDKTTVKGKSFYHRQQSIIGGRKFTT